MFNVAVDLKSLVCYLLSCMKLGKITLFQLGKCLITVPNMYDSNN